MTKISSIAMAVNCGLVASISSLALVSGYAVSAEEGADVERIQVTGSRIQRQDMESASPVTVIDSAEITAGGYTSVDEILQSQPSMAGKAIGSTSNNGTGGTANVDLRGMGSNRTLVLLNGRRMVNSGTGADSSVDLNTIPVAMIARVEILKDGASAVYGSDAIAGVVNIITKQDFEGFQLDVKGGATGEGDGENVELSSLYGFSTETGNYTIGLAYSDRNGVLQGDRDWVTPGASSFVPSGSLGGKIKNDQGQWVARDSGYDYTKQSWLQTPSTRYSLFLNATEELGNDVVFTGDLLYTRRESTQMMAPQPASVVLNVCGEPGVSPDKCITLNQAMLDGGITANKSKVEYRRRMTDAGNRISEQKTDTIRASAGLAGSLDIHTGMNWDVSYTYGKNEADTWVDNSINAKKMEDSMYANSDAWFSGQPLSQAIIDDVSYKQARMGGNEQHIVSAVIDGELFDLDAGPVAFAVGAEYRSESGYFNPDPVVVAGHGTSAQQDPTKGDYSVISVYQEVNVPFTDKLTGEFAIRLDDYSTFGNASTWKIGLTYELTDDLMLRTVSATGFRAPSVSELYGGNSGSYDYLTDPWGNAQDPQILVNRTSDPDLKAEESESFTAGFVYSPSYLNGASMTVDYWRFKITNAIARKNVQAGLNSCFGGDNTACEEFSITASGDLTTLTSQLTNVGSQDTSGIDLNLAYSFEGLGFDWRVTNDLVHLLEFKQDGTSYTGTVGGLYGGYARVKNTMAIKMSQGDWSIRYSNRFISEMKDINTQEAVDSVLYHDISGNYHISDGFTATLGLKNFTDVEPSSVPSGNTAGTVPEVYNTVGREVFAGVSYKF